MPVFHKLLIFFAFFFILGFSDQRQTEFSDTTVVTETLFETALSKVANWYIGVFSDFEHPDTVLVEQELKGVSVEMLNWWWNNIDDTPRYQSWHPKDHIYFKWLVIPADKKSDRYSPGAVQEVRERIGGIPATLEITWLPFDHEGYDVKESNFVKASGKLVGISTNKTLLFLHEYSTTKDGVFMRSTFKIPSGLPGMFKVGLATHCQEEMQYLAKVLPEYYKAR